MNTKTTAKAADARTAYEQATGTTLPPREAMLLDPTRPMGDNPAILLRRANFGPKKVTLYPKDGGEPLVVDPIDAKEIMRRSDDYSDEPTEGADADGMTVAELKEALDAKGVEYPSGARKAELQALLDGGKA